MGCLSKVCRMKRRGSAAGTVAIGALPIPDPRLWPMEVRQWLRRVSGDSAPFGVLIFDRGDIGAMYLQDAVTALGILGLEDAEWHTEDGYPAFEFAAEKIADFARLLTSCGYSVRVVQMAGRKNAGRSIDLRTRGEVVCIATAKAQGSTEGAKWD